MALVDANVLLYAVNSDAQHHKSALRWIDESLSGEDLVHFAWGSLLAFVRLATRDGLFPRPLSTDQAFDRVDAWLAQPNAVLVQPGPAHGGLLRRLLATSGSGGNLVTDAHLAALAIEANCPVASFDRDFGRFADVQWFIPGA
jgi:uncharacterized protein